MCVCERCVCQGCVCVKGVCAKGTHAVYEGYTVCVCVFVFEGSVCKGKGVCGV